MIIYLREKGLAQILIGAVTVAFVIGSIFLYGSSDLASNSSPDEVVEKLEIVIKAISDKLINRSSGAYNFNTEGIDELVLSGVKSIIQPSGSINDKEIIKFANKLGIILVFSKTRHFRH